MNVGTQDWQDPAVVAVIVSEALRDLSMAHIRVTEVIDHPVWRQAAESAAEVKKTDDLAQSIEGYLKRLDQILPRLKVVPEELVVRIYELLAPLASEHKEFAEDLQAMSDTFLRLRKPFAHLVTSGKELEETVQRYAACADEIQNGDRNIGRSGIIRVRMTGQAERTQFYEDASSN